MPESGSTDHLNVNTTQWEFSRWMMTENKNQNNIYYCDYGKNYTNSIYQIIAAVLQLLWGVTGLQWLVSIKSGPRKEQWWTNNRFMGNHFTPHMDQRAFSDPCGEWSGSIQQMTYCRPVGSFTRITHKAKKWFRNGLRFWLSPYLNPIKHLWDAYKTIYKT